MIRLTHTGKIVYQMLGQIVILLMVYAMLFLLSATQSLPYFTIAHLIPSNLIVSLTECILHLVILTGIVTAGMVMCNADNRYLLRLYYAWTGLIIITLLFTGFDIAPLLDSLTALLLFGYLGLSLWSQPPSPFLRIWRVGIVLIIVSIVVQWVVTDRWLAVILLFRVHVAYSVTGISIMFWLMTHWSNVRAEWARDGVMIVSWLIAFAGVLMSIAPLALPSFIGFFSAFVVPVCYMILAGHSYRALRDRNQNLSLSPHWIAIAVLLWLAGGGFLGTLSTQVGIQQWLQGTRLAQAQHWFLIWGMLAIILSLVNNTATQLRGENRRVTGYMPLWLIAFGSGFGGVVLGCAGVVEIYLLRFLTIDRATVETLLIPLSIVWIVCLLIVAIGIAIYALGFWIRRPTIIVD